MVETLAKLDRAFAELRFDEMADAIYHFVWGTFCDWYVELIKGAFDEETKAVAAWVFDQILVMLHPFMPFVTEELWNAMGERPYELIVAKWPEPRGAARSARRGRDRMADRFCRRKSRAMRTELNVPWSATLEPHRYWRRCRPVERWPDRNSCAHGEARPGRAPPPRPPAGLGADRGATARPIAFPLRAYRSRSRESAAVKAAEAAEKERDSLAGRLANPNFTERAKPEAVEKARSDHHAKAAEAERLRAALERLG